jgi:hypothetical protein
MQILPDIHAVLVHPHLPPADIGLALNGLIAEVARYLCVRSSVLGAARKENIVQKCINIDRSCLGLLFSYKSRRGNEATFDGTATTTLTEYVA